MTNAALIDCLQPELVTVERVNYFPRQLLTADDMFADQEYFLLKLRRHNRFMHGWGTVCGLLVTADANADFPWQVQISGGYALGPYGDEIFVAEPILFDLSSCGAGATDPCEPEVPLGSGGSAAIGAAVYVAIKYSECFARPVRVMPSGCGCDQTACENSRVRDSFQIQCLSSLPASYQLPPSTATLCDFIDGRHVPDCPPCPSDPWVVLAAVTLPASLGVPVSDFSIDNYSLRRQILSTATLQDQIVECCCGPAPTPTPTPTPAPESADLEIRQVFTFVALGTQLLTITVTNHGPSTAKDVNITATITGDRLALVLNSTDFSINGNVLTKTVASLQPNQSVSGRCTMTHSPVAEVTPTSTATVASSSTYDPNPANNTNTLSGPLF